MSSIRLRRLASVTSVALLAAMVLGPASANALPPKWTMNVAYLPVDGVVAPGESAGFVVTITNTGRSNISALYLSTDPDDDVPAGSPTYIGPITYANQPMDPDAFCNPAGEGPLFCDLGNLVGNQEEDASVTVTVAFATPPTGTSWNFTFQAFGNGNTPSDGGTSHGDTLDGPVSVTLNSSKNFDGGFNLDGSLVANVADLGKKNIQSGQITPPAGETFIPVTVEDGLPSNAFICPTTEPACANRFGEWTRLNVNHGAEYGSGFKVVITIWGPAVPKDATVETIKLIHVSDTHGTHTISARCTGDGLNADGDDADTLGDECITVTRAGNNFRIVAWLISNGGSRTAY